MVDADFGDDVTRLPAADDPVANFHITHGGLS
jgi:hypothetical protein